MHANTQPAAPTPERRGARSMPAAPRRPRGRGYTQRRRAMAVPVQAHTSRFEQLWNEHAVKAGMLVFYAWFAAANWSKLQHVITQALG